MKDNQEILIIGFVWPEPNSSAAGLRMLQLIQLFLRQNWKVTFASSATESDFMFNLASIGVKSERITLNSDCFDTFLREVNPSIVLFDRFMTEEQFGWRVASQCPDAIRILDTEDLHCLRKSRQKALNENRFFELQDMLDEDISKREIASILRSDITLMVSEIEIDILRSFFRINERLLYYLPIFVELEKEELYQWKQFEEKTNFMFIGNFLHQPNWDTVQYLKESIWPSIRKKLPQAVLNIYGAYPSQKVFQLHDDKQGFHIKGRVGNIAEIFQNSRVFLAPIRFGAGIKGKLLEAMQLGTPSVTSTIGAESMSGNLQWNGSIADEPNLFVEKAVELYLNKKKWNEARQNGISILKERYQRVNFESDFVNHILKIQQELKQHRKDNFLGALLQHHTLRSTEYMSRWIQEKNKTQFD